MVQENLQDFPKVKETYHLRKLAKSGNSRYLSIGKLVPEDWVGVKVFVDKADGDSCTLRLEAIR